MGSVFDKLRNIGNKQESLLEKYNCTVLSDISDGARIKLWVIGPAGFKCLYKVDRKHPTGEYTYEALSEYLAMLIADVIKVPCVRILKGDHEILSQVATNNSLHSFIEYSEEFSHSFHMSNLATFNVSTLLSSSNNEYHKDVIKMLLFDAFIGNSDRHPGNFAYTKENGFYPLYDNGSSLLAFAKDADIEDILNNIKRFESVCVTKSKSVVRDNQRLTHKELVGILRSQFPVECADTCDRIVDLDIRVVLDAAGVPVGRWELLYNFLKYRKAWFA